MIERLRAAWAALRGDIVLHGHGWVVITGESVRWDGMTQEQAATALYLAADTLVDTLPRKQTIH